MKLTDFFTRVDTVTTEKVKDIIENQGEDSFNLIDVREPQEYRQGHLPGAQLLPLSGLIDNLDNIDKSKKTITYCAAGVRSRSAAALLKRNGFSEVISMAGGINAWNGRVSSGEYEFGLYLLEERESPEELVALAWGLEEGARTFYKRSIDIVSDRETVDLLESLIKAEERHKEHLIEALRDIKKGDINVDMIKGLSPKGIMESGISVDEAIDWVKKQGDSQFGVLEMSMQLEANSLDLYIKMFREINSTEAQKVFGLLVQEEKAHLARLGKLLESKIR